MIDSLAERAYSIGDRLRSFRSSTKWKLKIASFVSSEQSLHALNSPSDVSLSDLIHFDGISNASLRIDIVWISGNDESSVAEESLMFIPEIPEILAQMPWLGS